MRLLLNFVRQLGFDPIRLSIGLKNLPRFLTSFLGFVAKKPKGRVWLSPVLLDFDDQAGSADGHYFWQDLIVAQRINLKNPKRHVDIGSRVDGFIAHLLSFRSVELIDVRPLSVEIPNLKNLLGNAQDDLVKVHGLFDSVSSLHAIEHFGLGRYRDPLDPLGHQKGLFNISNLVMSGGYLYVSFPIGTPVTHFNSQRIMHPEWLPDLLDEFELEEFILIPWKGQPIYSLKPSEVNLQIKGQCGLYILKRGG